jgi:hypothetical protein
LAEARDGDPSGMSTDAGNAAAPEDIATREAASARPGLESADPDSADSATSTPETADRGIAGSARDDDGPDGGAGSGRDDDGPDGGAGATDAEPAGQRPAGASEGFVADMLRDATITGLPGETGEPPVEPHAPQAQQEGDEPVGSEPPVGDNPYGAD